MFIIKKAIREKFGYLNILTNFIHYLVVLQYCQAF